MEITGISYKRTNKPDSSIMREGVDIIFYLDSGREIRVSDIDLSEANEDYEVINKICWEASRFIEDLLYASDVIKMIRRYFKEPRLEGLVASIKEESLDISDNDIGEVWRGVRAFINDIESYVKLAGDVIDIHRGGLPRCVRCDKILGGGEVRGGEEYGEATYCTRCDEELAREARQERERMSLLKPRHIPSTCPRCGEGLETRGGMIWRCVGGCETMKFIDIGWEDWQEILRNINKDWVSTETIGIVRVMERALREMGERGREMFMRKMKGLPIMELVR